MKFKIGSLNITWMLTHRWQKKQNTWDKERWNDFRLGIQVRYWSRNRILIGFYLIVAKTWVVFHKN